MKILKKILVNIVCLYQGYKLINEFKNVFGFMIHKDEIKQWECGPVFVVTLSDIEEARGLIPP